ncbi:MAG: hypothetical protein JO288_11290 [Hyphomicrobiales bacterium]|nr:hypothetical protein [Hyphomicrobiales bacterium]
MKVKLTVGLKAIAACALLGVVPARATTIDIGVAQGIGGAITTEASGNGSSGVTWGGFFGGFNFTAVTAQDPTPLHLSSGTLDVSFLPSGQGSSTAPILVYVTETGLTAAQVGQALKSTLGVTSLSQGWSETETTYLDVSGNAYGKGTVLATASMNGAGSQSFTTGVTPTCGPSGCSITEVYELFSNGYAGYDISSEDVQGNVGPAPAPAIGAGVPSVLAVGAMLLGTTLLSRRRRS